MELTHEELTQASAEDIEFFNKCIEGLPTMAGKHGDGKDKFGQPIPYGSGPHIARHFREAIAIVNPAFILEIGLNCGAGAAMLLALSDAFVYSIDISDREETTCAGNVLYERYKIEAAKSRFEFKIIDSKKAFFYLEDYWPFDMAWIDGGHEEADVIADIELCKALKIPYILGDDFYPRFGPGVAAAFAKFPELELVKDMNNLRLYKWQNL